MAPKEKSDSKDEEEEEEDDEEDGGETKRDGRDGEEFDKGEATREHQNGKECNGVERKTKEAEQGGDTLKTGQSQDSQQTCESRKNESESDDGE